MTEIEKKTGMTDAECEYWDEYFTNQNYKPTGPNLLDFGIKPGFANRTLNLSELDEEVTAYLRTQSEKFQKNHTQVLSELVHEKLAVGV